MTAVAAELEALLRQAFAPSRLILRDDSAAHAGHAGAWILEWDGTRFVKVSDLLKADQEAIVPLVEAEAKKYAEANAPWPVNEECKM